MLFINVTAYSIAIRSQQTAICACSIEISELRCEEGGSSFDSLLSSDLSFGKRQLN